MDNRTPADARRPRVISMFSGMEAASVAAEGLGWDFVAYAEVEPAACWTLHHHHGCGKPMHMPRPEDASSEKDRKERLARVKAVAKMPEPGPGKPVNLGDVTQVDWEAWRGRADVVVGGPPCQAFSFAGLRGSLDDSRGLLSLHYVRAIHAIRPLWVFTENVFGWLNTKDNAFGCYLGALVGADSPLEPPDGKRWGCAGVVDGPLFRAAWRVLDAQGFVPQRRRRVFVVASRVGTGGDPVRVLFETEAEVAGHLGERAYSGPLFPVRQGVPGHPAARGGARQGAARDAEGGAGGRGGEGEAVACRLHAAFSTAMTSNGKARAADEVDVARSLDTCGGFATNQGGNIVVQEVPEDKSWVPETSTTLRARDGKGSPDSDCTQTLIAQAVEDDLEPRAFGGNNCSGEIDVSTALTAHGGPHGRMDFESETFVCVPLPEGGHDDGEQDAIAFHGRQDPIHGPVTPAVDTDPYSICVATQGEEREAVAFDVRNGKELGDLTQTVQSHHRSYGVNAQPVICERVEEPVFLHCNKGRPAGRKSAHTEMVTVKPLVETLTTDGHAQSAVAVPDDEPLFAFSSKDHGADVGSIAPTLRAAPHHHSHPNSGSHVAIVHPEPQPPGVLRRVVRWVVRRLMPVECLALQGFPRNYLDGVQMGGKELADGPRYKLIGNSWPVPVVAWIFGRMDGHVAEQFDAQEEEARDAA